MSAPVRVVEHLFRHSAGRITATLARVLGPARLDLAEETVGEPRPGDDELALMLLCCHPELPMTSQVAPTLKTVGGLGVNEIAAALLTKPATVAQRPARAKRWLRTSGRPIELPAPETPVSRVDSVLSVLYLLFNEGYDTTVGEVAVRGELCGEAIRLGRLLLADRRTDIPKARALLALMLLQASRLPARVDADGEILLLDAQNRDRWDRALIAAGTRTFANSGTGPEKSAYHVEVAIALCHVTEGTGRPRILALYDELAELRDSPVVLNRAIAPAMANGPAEGIAEPQRRFLRKRLAECVQS